MGNCIFRGFGEVEAMVKVVTSNGGVMELYAPITAECITNEFPGHGIFRSQDVMSPPLLHKEELRAGQFYYLLPLNTSSRSVSVANTTRRQEQQLIKGIDHTSHSDNNISSGATPYRMSFHDNRGTSASKRSAEAAEVFPRYNSTGVWKVRLVINPEQLSEILSQEARTEALIESVRTVAKCGNACVSSVANSDQWSLPGSWKTASEHSATDC